MQTCKFYECTYGLKFIVEIGCFVCVCILCGLSSKNPFESHVIANLSNYFYDEENTTTLIANKRKYNNVSIINFTTEDYTLNESKNISSDKDIKKNLFSRKLVSESFCSDIYDKFVKYKDSRLSNIFDLNYGKIFNTSIANLVISCLLLVCVIIFSCLKNWLEDHKWWGVFSALFILFLYIARFILSIILLYFMEKGDIEKYDEFLECKNVKEKFFNKFSDVNKLRKCFIAFFILNIIIQAIDQIEKCCECGEKSSEEENKSSTNSLRARYNKYFYSNYFY